MDYDAIIAKLTEKTENNKQEWRRANFLPSGIVLGANSVTKIFYTDINPTTDFYLVEYSYKTYLPSTDESYLDYAIKGSFMQGDIEVENITPGDLFYRSGLSNLMKLVLRKFSGIEDQLDNFLKSE